MIFSLAERGCAPSILSRKAANGVPVFAVFASILGGVIAAIANFVAPSSGIFDFIMNSAGLVALFVYVFIAVTQLNLRRKMSRAEVDSLQLKVWAFPWLNIPLIAAVVAVVIIMLTSPDGRTRVWTSLVATAVLVVFWPVVARKLKKRESAERSEDPAL